MTTSPTSGVWITSEAERSSSVDTSWSHERCPAAGWRSRRGPSPRFSGAYYSFGIESRNPCRNCSRRPPCSEARGSSPGAASVIVSQRYSRISWSSQSAWTRWNGSVSSAAVLESEAIKVDVEFKEPLFAPPPLFCRTVDAGLLGRKVGRASTRPRLMSAPPRCTPPAAPRSGRLRDRTGSPQGADERDRKGACPPGSSSAGRPNTCPRCGTHPSDVDRSIVLAGDVVGSGSTASLERAGSPSRIGGGAEGMPS